MEVNYVEDELQEIIKLNGQTVSNALAMLKNNATEREVSDYISNYTGQPQNLVAREVIAILRFAVSNGFLVKNGNTYTLPSHEFIYNLDCDASDSSGNEPDRSAVELVRGGDDEPECIVGSGEKNAPIEDTTEESSDATCERGVKETDLKELMDWLDSPEIDTEIELAID